MLENPWVELEDPGVVVGTGEELVAPGVLCDVVGAPEELWDVVGIGEGLEVPWDVPWLVPGVVAVVAAP